MDQSHVCFDEHQGIYSVNQFTVYTCLVTCKILCAFRSLHPSYLYAISLDSLKNVYGNNKLIVRAGELSSWRTTVLQSSASTLLHTPDPADHVRQGYLKTTGVCVGAGLGLNAV